MRLSLYPHPLHANYMPALTRLNPPTAQARGSLYERLGEAVGGALGLGASEHSKAKDSGADSEPHFREGSGKVQGRFRDSGADSEPHFSVRSSIRDLSYVLRRPVC
jgi:hypothetical protein